MLCLADRGFYSFKAWENACGSGADLLWRVKDNLILEPVKDLPDGSWLAHVFHSTTDRARQHPVRVRVISYTIEDGRDPAGPYRLITTLLDHRKAPAAQLAAAYAQRWEIETAFDELKTHQRGPRAVLRSKSPKLVTQEIWGHLCCHYAIRSLMLDAADHSGHDPDRVSFVAALRISRRSIAGQGAFPP
jgi:IS4 transposase